MSATTASPTTRRDEILSIASGLFYEQGFGSTGIKQIIDEAGIAKGTFYSHFDSKESLGVAWLKARHSEWNGWLHDYLKKFDTSAEKIIAIYDFLESWIQDCGYRGCAFINTMAETPNFENPMRGQVATHKESLHRIFQELAREHYASSDLSEEEATQKGTTFYLLFEGALVEAQNFHETWPVKNARACATQFLNLTTPS